MVNVKDKETFQISMEDIIGELENSEYKQRYKIYNTCLGQDANRWRRGYKSKFQQSLVDDNLMFFAYIKFYLDGGKNMPWLLVKVVRILLIIVLVVILDFIYIHKKVLQKNGYMTMKSSGAKQKFWLYQLMQKKKKKVAKRQRRLKNI